MDYSQRAVEVHNVAGSYTAGENVTFDVASWTMSTADDVKDTEVQVKLGDTVLGTATLDNTIGTAVYDQYGTAHVDVALPAGTPGGDAELTLVGANTGTEIPVEINDRQGDRDGDRHGRDRRLRQGHDDGGHGRGRRCGADRHGHAEGGRRPASGPGHWSTARRPRTSTATGSAPGVHTVTITYSGDGSVEPATGSATLTVNKATPTVIGTKTTMEYGQATTMAVRVGATGVVPTGQVVLKVGDVRLGSGTLTDGVATATIGAKKVPHRHPHGDDHLPGRRVRQRRDRHCDARGQKATPTVIGSATPR